ncbi:hypothetical protein BN1708_012083 [Verticillium longisporum]|uniref:Zn(2)-C6 fungal-type domain-containing protein n=1 Tax=Verticillium longisporum TaxID=100787 RepID=A0A0G4L707_VERLO|nr:hypothetical protein BN1708_012083 [Verticillium longisporum]
MSEPQPHPPVALITAGSAGLGAAAAKLLARKGYRVVINYYSNKARADALATELHTLSPLPHDAHNFVSVQANLESRDEIKSLVQAASDFSVQSVPPATKRRLDVVFSNGGWTQIRDIRNLDDNLVEDDWDRCFNMNVKSHLWLMGAAKPYLEEAEGCFITTASLAGVKVSGSSLAYAVSKAAQIHLAKGLAMAAAPKIRVNTVSPGIMWTDWGLQFPEEQREAARERTPLKRVPTVEEVAEQVWCFIQSKTVTGANAVIDGAAAAVAMATGPSSLSNLLHPNQPAVNLSQLPLADRQLFVQAPTGGSNAHTAEAYGSVGIAEKSNAHAIVAPTPAPTHAATPSLYQCAHCQKRYSRPEHLARHIQTHTLGKRFACQVCGKAFARQDLLKRHITNHENDDDPAKKRRRTTASPAAARVSHACRGCAAARVKCEETKPCTRCRTRNQVCEYSAAEAGSAAAMYLLHLSADPRSETNSPASSASQSASDAARSSSHLSVPQISTYPATGPDDGSVVPTLSVLDSGPTQPHPPKSIPLQSRLHDKQHRGTIFNAEEANTGMLPQHTHVWTGNQAVDVAGQAFSGFLHNVIYEPGYDGSRVTESHGQGQVQGLSVLDLSAHNNLDLTDVDFSLLDYWNVDLLGDGFQQSQTFTLSPEDSIDLVQMRKNLVQAWTESPWRWSLSRINAGYGEQSNLPVPSPDVTGALREGRKKLGETVMTDRLDGAARDGVLAIVLKTCKTSEMMARVASSFPSAEVMDSLIHIFLASHFCQTSQWIHQATFEMKAMPADWHAMAAASGAVLTPVPTLRRWGFAVQEAVRVTIPEKFESVNTTIKDVGLVQSLSLVQDVALWSGNRRKMEIAECHIGIPANMMRYRNKYQRTMYPLIELDESDGGEVLEQKWRSWCERESWKRLAFHCFIRDARTSMATLGSPGMSYAEMTLPLPEAKELWFAKTALDWKHHHHELAAGYTKRAPSVGDLLRDPGLLTSNRRRLDVQAAVSIFLNGYWSLINEYQRLSSVQRFRPWLTRMGGTSEQLLRTRHEELCKGLDQFQAIVSDWHELSCQEHLMLHLLLMNLHLSLNHLQLFSGKEGEEQARRVLANLREWADSVHGRQAVWQAGQVLRQAKLFPLGHLKDFYAVAIHHAALALWTYGVVTKTAGRPGASSSQLGQETVYLDGTISGVVTEFVHFGHGKPVIQEPIRSSGTREAAVEDPKGCMEVVQETLRSNFRGSPEMRPPIIENMCLVMKQLGDAAWAVGLS